MRRKLTDPAQALDASDLPDLTPQQMAFVRGILEGKTGADAYRAAYDCSKSMNNTIWCEASKLRNNPQVAQWIGAARKAGLGTAVVTLEGHLAELERLREIALETGNVGAAVQAEQLRGKAKGHYVEKYEDVTKEDPADTLEQIARHSPELAKVLAAKHGLSLTTDTTERPDRLN